MIECRGLTIRAGAFELSDVSFIVPAGAHAILTGPTASGKTTLMETIAGAIDPVSGMVVLNGTDVTELQPEERDLALVHQRGLLFPHLDVEQNVRYGAKGHALAAELMRRFGIAEISRRKVQSLSGGERQLVALCRALASRRSVLLLDEPFSALDSDRRRATVDEFDQLARDWQLTVLHATHDIDSEDTRLRIAVSARSSF